MKNYTQVKRKISELSHHKKAECLTDTGLELLDELEELLSIAVMVEQQAEPEQINPEPSEAEKLLKRIEDLPILPSRPGTISSRELAETTLREIIRIDKK